MAKDEKTLEELYELLGLYFSLLEQTSKTPIKLACEKEKREVVLDRIMIRERVLEEIYSRVTFRK